MLDDCPAVWGSATVVERDPRVEVHEDVLYVPGGTGGLFDRGRRLVAGSGYYRGLPSHLGAMTLVHGSVFSPVDPDTVTETLDAPVVFGGVLIPHFGHFLIGTLARLWTYQTTRKQKHIMINHGELDPILAQPAHKVILSTLGFRSDSFFALDRPVRLRRVLVAYPSFDENSLVHRAYARLCAHIGATLCPSPRRQSSPVFLSKARMATGVTRIFNEEDLCLWLERRGVRIVHPETLPFADQVALFRGGAPITGFMGSAFHLSAFAPGCRLVAINYSPEIISNQVMIDRVCGNAARYVFDADTLDAHGEGDGFQRRYAIRDVERTGGALMRCLEAVGR